MRTSTSLLKRVGDSFTSVAQYLGAAFAAPSVRQAQFILFGLGVIILTIGIDMSVLAVGSEDTPDLGSYNDERFAEFVNRVFAYIEGSLGALLMVAAGLLAIISAAFGQYRAALALLVVAVGAFVLRSLVATFFNDDNIQ